MLLRRQPLDGHVGIEIGVSEVVRAIGVRASHGLRHTVEVARGAEPVSGNVVAFEDVQHLDEHDPAARRGRHRDDLDPAIRTSDRSSLLGAKRFQVLFGDQTTVFCHLLRDESRSLAFVETSQSLLGNAHERFAEIGLL